MSDGDRPGETAALKLLERRDDLQAELNTQYAILESNGATMGTPLVDPDGFPRADMDVYNVRLARVRIIELGNDLKAITDELANALAGVHARDEFETPGTTVRKEQRGFSRVASVAPRSPAAEAGLLVGDVVISFGGLGEEMIADGGWQTPVARLVTSQENETILVRVRRDGEEREMGLVPRSGWGGRGLLGCQLVGLGSTGERA